MEPQNDFSSPRHPIQVVAARTGLTMDVLRAWERRYGAVTPARTSTGRRRYSDADVERLILLKRALAGGRSIGQIAALDQLALKALLVEDDEAARAVPSVAGSTQRPDVESVVAAAIAAIQRLDGAELRNVLARAALEMSEIQLVERVLAPVMVAVGEEWREGTMRIAHEHLATATVQWYLGELMRRPPPHDAPTVVVATPVGQRHQVGAMLAASTAASLGWNVVYLGSDLPAEDIAAAASQSDARLIALSIVYPDDSTGVSRELALLARSVSPRVAVVLGGQASADYAQLAGEMGWSVLPDLREFRDLLHQSNPQAPSR